MKRSTVVVVMIAMLVGGVPGVSAQTLSEGARVRVTTPQGKLKGTLASTDTEAFTLALENGGLLTIQRDSVERLDLSLGTKRNAGKGFLFGVPVGVAIGGAVWCNEESPCDTKERTDAMVLFGFMYGVTGALVGLLIKTERWQEVDTGPQITLTLPKRGIGAQVSVGW